MDRAQINQVIQNLVLNADQAMSDGGIIKISCDNARVAQGEIPGLEAGRYVRVSVQDSGSGIAHDILGRVFDPYFSTKEKDSQKGSGLGLAIVHSIISKHGGVIMVDSLPGAGSTFTLYLQAMEKEASGVVAESDNEVSTGRERILVMDDDEMIRDVICNMLTHLGYSSAQAADGKKALAMYTKSLVDGTRYDAVIMDLTIPGGMGGEEAVQKLLAVDSEAKVIVSSGYSRDPILDNYASFGFCNIVGKPYQLNELSRVLAETLSARPTDCEKRIL
jgi:CheY-like chemotaxis protein